jgi:hypothetical protein
MDERNEYYGISVQKLEWVTKSLGIQAFIQPNDKKQENSESVFHVNGNLVTR